MPTAVPRSTYRLQFHRGFTLDDAAAIVPYLSRLGISHMYASPLLQARAGSGHGYDIVNHAAINPELGSQESFARLCATLRAAGMGLVLDIVPNHMGVGADNAWWQDVLESGESSLRARFFDIDWHPAKPELEGKVLLPVLADHYGRVLEDGDLSLCWEHGAILVAYGATRFPIDPRGYPDILDGDMETLAAGLAAHPDMLATYAQLLSGLRELPPHTATDVESRARRARDLVTLKATLCGLVQTSEAVMRHLERRMARFNGKANAMALHALLERQAWRLAYWRTAADEVNYRRFFDVSELAGLRQEDPEVFAATHPLILRWVKEGLVQGLRVDHPDGLRDPAEYYERLGEAVQAARADVDSASEGIYTVAEKILAAGERLPRWNVCGTTGYDWLALVTGLFVAGSAEAAFRATLQQAVGAAPSFDKEAYSAKRHVMRTLLASELTVLAHRFNRLSEGDPHTRDYTLNALREAVAEVAARFPVYRTYVTRAGASTADRAIIDGAVRDAERHASAEDVSIYRFIRRVLLIEEFDAAPEDTQRAAAAIAARFQQFTAPLMAKAVEDTAFYRHPLLLARNEVGSDPRQFCVSVAAFQAENERRARECPHSMLATSTHDTKLSEDARLRLCVLSEFPEEWRSAVRRFRNINRRLRIRRDRRRWPERTLEYLLYQAALSIWPADRSTPAPAISGLRARLRSYALKAAREAKQVTSWVAPNRDYELAVAAFVDGMLPDEGGAFTEALAELLQMIARPAMLAAVSQQVLKLTCPGVPDIYQGTELGDFSLVDPDNRRPVDFDLRARELDSALARPPSQAALRGLFADPGNGRAKLYVTARTLAARRDRPALFRDGDYRALPVTGPMAGHVCAFAREHEAQRMLVIATRWHATLARRWTGRDAGASPWQDTYVGVPSGWSTTPAALVDIYTGAECARQPAAASEQLSLAALLAAAPVACLLDVGAGTADRA